jgi:hypothetical protein
MKKQIIILLAIVSILVSSCSKEEIQLNRDYFGTIKVLKTGKEWKPLIYASHNTKEKEYVVLHIEKLDEQNFVREGLYLHRIAKKIGYNVIKSQEKIENFPYVNNIRRYSSYYVTNIDVICSSYQVADSTEMAGFVNVINYDESSGKIEGTFEVTLIKKESCDTNAPDTLHFTEGVFSTKIQD